MKRIAIAVICLSAVASHAATFTVINTNDTGAGSLRAAISNANANAGSHLIDFAIPGAGVQTINPVTTLPALTKSVTIDGYTQPGASANSLANDDNAILLIELNGTGTGGNGLNINVTNCVIRGLVINRFTVNGLSTDGSRDNVIEGNFIGTDPTGTIKRPNASGLLIGGQNTLVGGTTAAARNLISGNTGQGLATSGTATTNITVQGNFIGTDVHGTAALGNGSHGVGVGSATKNTIGGTATGAGNLIAGNGGNGVNIVTSNNVVQGNFIGTDLTGTLNLSNSLDGVALSSARNNIIGGATGNVIAFNGGAGVSISATVPNNTNNLISANSIFSNGALGINLIANTDAANGVSSNDVNDVDTGANHLQNFPVLTSASSDANSVTIAGLLDSAASTAFTLEFFANTACDPSGFGEGETFIGATNVTTGANHTNVFTVTFPVAIPNGLFITATATDPNNDTSEFSKCFTNQAAATCLESDSTTNDVWDVNRGVIITASSGSGAGALENMFGARLSSPELGTAFFSDSQTSGFVHFVEWQTPTPVLVTNYNLIGLHTATNDLARAFSQFNLYGFNSSNSTFELLVALTPPLPYGQGPDERSLYACGPVSPLATDKFRAEFVQAINGSFAAPRVIELDGFGTALSTNTAPQITCPGNIVTNTVAGNCTRSVSFIATATGTPTPTVTYWTNNVAVTSPVTFPKGVTTVTAKASNSVSVAMCTFTVTVNDNVLPAVTCPGNITSNVAAGVTSSVVDYTLNGTDNCPGVSVTGNPPSGSTFGLGTTPVTITAVDGAANTNTCTFNVTVQAATACIITCPSDIVSNTAPGLCGATVTFNVGSSGTCPTAIVTPLSGSFFNKGTTPVTVTTNGVTACTFNVTVNDTIAPTINCSSIPITTNVAAGVTNAAVTFSVLATNDNCGIASVVSVPASGSTFDLGTSTVVTTATDTSGNTNSCSFSIIVQETPTVPHDLALLGIHVSKNINLKAASPALTKRVKVQIQNLSAHEETVPNLTVLADLVSVTLSNLHTDCVSPTADLIQGPPNKPKTIKPNGKLNVFFNVTYSTNCVPDAVKGAGHEDFTYTAHVNHAALDGNPDTMPANNDCPRGASGSDKGCLPVTTDVVVK